jgi:hypothetical protein
MKNKSNAKFKKLNLMTVDKWLTYYRIKKCLIIIVDLRESIKNTWNKMGRTNRINMHNTSTKQKNSHQ